MNETLLMEGKEIRAVLRSHDVNTYIKDGKYIKREWSFGLPGMDAPVLGKC
jgi:hypothetical protein